MASKQGWSMPVEGVVLFRFGWRELKLKSLASWAEAGFILETRSQTCACGSDLG
jgi:hypothetical protein